MSELARDAGEGGIDSSSDRSSSRSIIIGFFLRALSTSTFSMASCFLGVEVSPFSNFCLFSLGVFFTLPYLAGPFHIKNFTHSSLSFSFLRKWCLIIKWIRLWWLIGPPLILYLIAIVLICMNKKIGRLTLTSSQALPCQMWVTIHSLDPNIVLYCPLHVKNFINHIMVVLPNFGKLALIIPFFLHLCLRMTGLDPGS